MVPPWTFPEKFDISGVINRVINIDFSCFEVFSVSFSLVIFFKFINYHLLTNLSFLNNPFLTEPSGKVSLPWP